MRIGKRVLRLAAAFAVLLAAPGLTHGAELIDGIQAVVGAYVVLKSEVAFQLQLWAMQQDTGKLPAREVEKLQSRLIEQMVDDKLILIRALKDTSITVSADEIERALDQRLEELKSWFPSETEFEAQLALEGLTYRELKNKFREEMREKLYKDRLIGRELSRISILPSEVRQFFEVYKDSLPPQPEIIKLAHILLEVEPSLATQDSVLAKASRIKELLDEGADFEEVAGQYSDDPSAESGGDLGYFGKGDLVAEFEKAAFALDVGEVSDIVRTQFGYHIIRCEDKLGDRIRCRHILCMMNATEQDRAGTVRLADSLKTAIEQGGDFAETAKQFSADDESKKRGGELDWFVFSDLTPEFTAAVGDIKVGEISEPTSSQFGIHILKVLDRQQSRPWSLEYDLDRLKEFVRRQKTEVVVRKLIEELRAETYVEIRDL